MGPGIPVYCSYGVCNIIHGEYWVRAYQPFVHVVTNKRNKSI